MTGPKSQIKRFNLPTICDLGPIIEGAASRHEKSTRGTGASWFEMVPEVRLELTRVSPTVFETAASAIPPLGHCAKLWYQTSPGLPDKTSLRASHGASVARRTSRRLALQGIWPCASILFWKSGTKHLGPHLHGAFWLLSGQTKKLPRSHASFVSWTHFGSGRFFVRRMPR